MNYQVEPQFYNFFKYLSHERWSSYWWQLKLILSKEPKKILEVGVGDGVVGDYFKHSCQEIDYTSVDYDHKLNPTVVAEIKSLPFSDNSFDVVCCFEVLEHLPFSDSIKAFKELVRVSSKYIIISLPHWGRFLSWEFYLPILKRKGWGFKFPSLFPPKHIFNGQHYWEIGKRGYSVKVIKNSFSSNNIILKDDFISRDNPYHHFFIYEKKL